MIETHIMKYPVDLFCRMVRVMADREFQDDSIFWERFAFKYVFFDSRTKKDRVFEPAEAKQLWDTFVLLKLKCPVIEVSEVLSYLEQFMEREAP